MQPQGSTLSGRCSNQRPKSLSRPAPVNSRTYITQTPTRDRNTATVSGIASLARRPAGAAGKCITTRRRRSDQGPTASKAIHAVPCCGLSAVVDWVAVVAAAAAAPGCRSAFSCRFRLSIVSRPIGGVQGFTGPANRGGSGSFGFHEGFNWGMPISCCLAGQFGATWTQNNFDGNYPHARSTKSGLRDRRPLSPRRLGPARRRRVRLPARRLGLHSRTRSNSRRS